MVQRLTILNQLQGTHQVYQGKAEDNGDEAADETYYRHVALLHQTRGISQGVGRRRNGKYHSRRGSNGHANEYGGRASDGVELIAHGSADNGEDGHEQRCRGAIADEVAEQIADNTSQEQDEQRRELAEGDALYGIGCQSAGIEAIAEGKATGYHPDDTPVDLLQVTLVDDSRQGEDHEGYHGYGIGVDARHTIQQPQGHRDEESDDDYP